MFVKENPDRKKKKKKSIENPSKHLIHFVEHASECHIIKPFSKAPFCLAIPLLTSFEKITAGHRY